MISDLQIVSSEKETTDDELWLKMGLSENGEIRVRLRFVVPYFCVEIFGLDRVSKGNSLADFDSIREFAWITQHLVNYSHVHSFVYDYHLRVLVAYLTQQQPAFKNTYSIQAFLLDFLNYCRNWKISTGA